MYTLPEEHELLRQTVRELAEAKIAPAAAAVDAAARFPAEALDALTGAGLHAAHIPPDYGGEGATPRACGPARFATATTGYSPGPRCGSATPGSPSTTRCWR